MAAVPGNPGQIQIRSNLSVQVIDPYFPFNNSSVEDFTVSRHSFHILSSSMLSSNSLHLTQVGTEDCEDRHGKCNGKLKPGTIYWFKVNRHM